MCSPNDLRDVYNAYNFLHRYNIISNVIKVREDSIYMHKFY